MTPTADSTIARYATLQHGVFTNEQAKRSGLSQRQIDRRVADGRWIRLTRGVYAVAGMPRRAEQLAMAASLTRSSCWLSHLTAAWLLGVDLAPPPRPHLTILPGGSGRSPIATIHRLDVPGDARTRINGMPCTTAARTVVDCASLVGSQRMIRIADDLLNRGLTTAGQIERQLESAPHVSGAAIEPLRTTIEVWMPAVRPESAAEARLLRQIASWGLPPPTPQIQVRDEHGRVVARLDGGWPDRRLAYEYDSVRWHGPARWASDEDRHRRVTALGWRLLHIDKADLRPGETHLRIQLTREYYRSPSPEQPSA